MPHTMNATTVLCVGDVRAAARTLLPQLPESGFTGADPSDLTASGDGQLVVVGTLDGLAAAAGDGALREVTAAMGGTADLADAAVAGDGYTVWEGAGLLGTCGRELCRRVAEGMDAARPTQVVLVDRDATRMVGMYGRLGR